MSLAHFQDAMVRLITDPDFRDHIAAGHAATDATLSEREAAREVARLLGPAGPSARPNKSDRRLLRQLKHGG